MERYLKYNSDLYLNMLLFLLSKEYIMVLIFIRTHCSLTCGFYARLNVS